MADPTAMPFPPRQTMSRATTFVEFCTPRQIHSHTIRTRAAHPFDREAVVATRNLCISAASTRERVSTCPASLTSQFIIVTLSDRNVSMPISSAVRRCRAPDRISTNHRCSVRRCACNGQIDGPSSRRCTLTSAPRTADPCSSRCRASRRRRRARTPRRCCTRTAAARCGSCAQCRP